jgi:predicted ATPase/DNA-binding SARP family transcriptional activator
MNDAFALVIHLFGPFEARLHGQPLPRLHSRKGQWLLALLVLRHGRAVERAWLSGTLWPDSSEEAANASLRNTLKDLRRALGSEAGRLRSPTTRSLSLDLDGAHADVLAFDVATAHGDAVALERAVKLYRGPLLEGCAEEWVLQERQIREQAYLTALETLATHTIERGDLGAAERHLQQVVAVEPLRESAQRALMQALAARGSYAAATQVYRELRLRLHRELNAAPDPETQALYQQLRSEARGKADAGRQTPDDWPRGHSAAAEPSAGPAPGDWRLAAGTLTFLFTDIEGSSQLWERYPVGMREALQHHDCLLRQAIECHGGLIFKTVGDAFYAVFATAPVALAATLVAQQALQTEEWGETGSLRVRMALHTGIAEQREGDYFGPTLNRVARLLDAGHGAQVLLSLPTEELVRDALPEGASLRPLGEHRLKDLVRPERVFQLLHPHLPSVFPPLRSLEAFVHNLPVQWTSFIGREQEMEEVKRLLPTSPLLTLSGAGGCGKTRLALQIAADLLEAYSDGVWLVELAALSEPALVPQTVAAALGVPEQPGRPIPATLIEHLRSRSLLLLLDNCEHVLGACGDLVNALLRVCPKLRILATSRERLGLTGERVYLVPSLSLPALASSATAGDEVLAEALRSEAVRLFAERAVYSQPRFTLTAQNAAVVVQLCRRLDGIPLALELAAARVKALSVEQIAARLDDAFRLLTGGSRTALPRQQTLRALIDWSYDLLSEAEQALLLRLSVFAGGWTLEQAEAVCSECGMRNEVLDLLTSLVDKSLVVYEEGGQQERYRLLETVRQYARERLPEAGDAKGLWHRHMAFFLQWVEAGLGQLEEVERFDRLETEHDNLRAALAWSLSAEDGAETGLRLATALLPFWLHRGLNREGREWLTRALARSGDVPVARRAPALDAAGRAACNQGDYAAARSLHEESLTLLRELGDKREFAFALYRLGFTIFCQGDEYDQAAALWEQSLAIYRELRYRPGIADSLQALGHVARSQGDYAAARSYYEEGLVMYRELENKGQLAHVLHNLGHVDRSEGKHGVAHAHYAESLTLFREQRHESALAYPLEGFAGLAAAEGKPRRAAHLWGSAEALREALCFPMDPPDRAMNAPYMEAARIALGEEAFAAAWAEGRSMPPEQAISYALMEPQP